MKILKKNIQNKKNVRKIIFNNFIIDKQLNYKYSSKIVETKNFDICSFSNSSNIVYPSKYLKKKTVFLKYLCFFNNIILYQNYVPKKTLLKFRLFCILQQYCKNIIGIFVLNKSLQKIISPTNKSIFKLTTATLGFLNTMPKPKSFNEKFFFKHEFSGFRYNFKICKINTKLLQIKTKQNQLNATI